MENKDIEIVEEQEKEGISIGDICKRIWHAKITLGVTFVVTTVVCALGIHYLYSKPQQVYTSSITYNFRGAEEGMYPDGTRFDSQTITSSDTINQVKDSKEEFSSIDVDKMIENNDITIQQRTATTYNEAGEEITSLVPNNFTLTVPSSYFDNDNQARDFIKALLETPNDIADSLYDRVAYDQNITLATAASSYEGEISYLINQRDYIYSEYNSLISEFGQSALSDKDSTITVQQQLNSVQTYFQEASHNLESLSTQATNYGYVKGSNGKDYNPTTDPYIYNLRLQLEDLVRSYVINEEKIENLQEQWALFVDSIGQSTNTALQPSSEFASQIATLTSQNVDLKYQIKNLALKLGITLDPNTGLPNVDDNGKLVDQTTTVVDVPDTFDPNLDQIIKDLKTFTASLKGSIIYLYTNYATPVYALPNIIEESGGLNILITGAISVVLGLILGCIVAGIKGHLDIKKEENNSKEIEELESTPAN